MITAMRGCVAHNDLWPWPISSRSFGLDLENRVRSVASTNLDGFFLYMAQMITSLEGVSRVTFFQNLKIWIFGKFLKYFSLDLEKKSIVGFFPYLAQMITSVRGCVAYNDLWPWPISSRSFDLDFENRVRSVTFSVLDRLFPYLPQIITTIRGCVTCYVYNKILKFKFFANFSNFSAFTLFWLGIRYELVNSMDLGFKMNWSIVWVIMGRRGVSSERRRSCYIYNRYFHLKFKHIHKSHISFKGFINILSSVSAVCSVRS